MIKIRVPETISSLLYFIWFLHMHIAIIFPLNSSFTKKKFLLRKWEFYWCSLKKKINLNNFKVYHLLQIINFFINFFVMFFEAFSVTLRIKILNYKLDTEEKKYWPICKSPIKDWYFCGYQLRKNNFIVDLCSIKCTKKNIKSSSPFE